MEDSWLSVSRIRRQVNTLIVMLPTVVDDGEAGVLVDAFAGSVSELTGQMVNYEWIEGLVEKRGEMDAAATFDHLMSILVAHPEFVPEAEAAADENVTSDPDAAAGTADQEEIQP